MQKRRQVLLTCLIAVLAILCCVGMSIYLEHGLRNKTAYEHMNLLMSDLTNEDVLVVGDSQACYDFLPMELWGKYGMTSYVIHANNNDIKRYKYMTDLACEYCEPKLIVLSTDQYWEQSSEETLLASYHEYADAFPLSYTKIKTTLDLFGNSEDKAEILFPFLSYHNRWKELSDSDFTPENSTLKGSDYSSSVESVLLPEPEEPIEPEIPEEGSENLHYIADFIEHFQSKGIPVMVVTFPFAMSSDSKKIPYLKALEDVVIEKGAAYYNFAVNHEMIDCDTDFKDEVHLNALGAKKMTSHLSNIFRESYGISSHFGEPDYEAEWNEDFNEYRQTKDECFQVADSLESALLLACDSDYNATVYLDWRSSAWQDKRIRKLITMLAPFERMDEAKETQCSFLGAADANHGVIGEFLDPDEDTWMAALGGKSAITDEQADAFVAVYDAHTGAPLFTKCFHTNIVLSSSMKE